MTLTHTIASLAIGKTIRAVACRDTEGDCFDIRLEFTDGSDPLIEGGFIDGDIRATLTAPLPVSPPSAAPPVRASDDGA